VNASAPVIGIDLDNTLISYDRLFHRLALEQKLIAADLPVNKTAVRDFLRRQNQEPAWTALQGLAYGSRLREAEAFAGALDFLREGKRRGWPMHIVSHKTRHPIVGELVDLHEVARGIPSSPCTDCASSQPRDHVWFEETKAAKIRRIRELHCGVFIDDLPELLLDPQFPREIRRILFAPQGSELNDQSIVVASTWAEITERLSHELA
jgi:hypothetical protein